VQVILDGAGAEEEPGSDVGIRLSFGGEARDVRLLRRQGGARLARRRT
jgi:hypothetical protein